ncbi:LysR family transcriptional regulator [Helcococcus kunzii]|nr:LysR family transcriptional regulator [Helcococcus kunzii]MCT1796444.1 LysR family transcriptional regulator [Helcococcus kunzii]MCT1989281.1 LysR family transcriptional regulator [Helcococcus kunzii]
MYKQFEYFIKVVELNSFTKAAEEMYISQSAISQQIKLLEEQLGAQLLDRKNRSFTLTPAGQYLYNESKILLSNTVEMINKVKEIANAKQHLRIGYLRTIDDSILYEALEELTYRNKNISFTLSKGSHDELYEELVGDTINISLNDQRRDFNQE